MPDRPAAVPDGVTARLHRQLDPSEADLLHAVLTHLDRHVHRALGEDLVGVYLVGSFALGAGDVHSDVDFLVVSRRQLTNDQERRVRDLHRALPDRPEHWAHVLEGSYAPAGGLAGRASAAQWLYVDNGQREIERSAHDDTEVLRWVLRHRGIVVSGAPVDALVPAVPTRALREEAARLAADRRDQALADPDYLTNGWGQPHEVLIGCRILYTAATGEVAGKSEAARWCLAVLPTRWHRLVEAAIDSRPDPWQRVHRRADPELAALTASFVEYVADRVANDVHRPA